MKAPKSILTFCAVASLGLAAFGQEAPADRITATLEAPAQQGARVPAALAVLVPDGAVAFGLTQAISELEGVAADIAREVMPQMVEAMNADILLSQVLPPGFDLTAIDRDRPFGFAVGPLSMESEPQVFVIIPTKNPDAIKALLPTEGPVYSTRVSEGYLGITRGLDYPVGTGTCPLLQGMPQGIVGVSVDMETIFDTFGPMIEFGMQMARMQMQESLDQVPEASMGMDINAIMDGYFMMAQNAIDSMEGLKLSVAVEETLVDFRWQAIVAEGSPMASLAQSTPTSAAAFLPLLTDESIAMVFGADMEKLANQMMPFMDMMMAAYPEDLAAGMTASMDSWKGMYGDFGTAMAISGGFTESGLRMAGYFDGTRYDELLAHYDRIVGEPFWGVMGMRYVDTKKARLGETNLTRYTFDFDVEGLLDQAGTEADAEQIGMMETMMEAMYGSQMVLTFAKTGELGFMAIGGDDAYVTAALERAKKPGKLAADLARLENMAARANPFMAYRFDIGRIMTEMGPIMESALGMPSMGMEMFEGTSLPMNIYVGITPLEWTGGLMVDVVQAGEFAQLVQHAGEL